MRRTTSWMTYGNSTWIVINGQNLKLKKALHQLGVVIQHVCIKTLWSCLGAFMKWPRSLTICSFTTSKIKGGSSSSKSWALLERDWGLLVLINTQNSSLTLQIEIAYYKAAVRLRRVPSSTSRCNKPKSTDSRERTAQSLQAIDLNLLKLIGPGSKLQLDPNDWSNCIRRSKTIITILNSFHPPPFRWRTPLLSKIKTRVSNSTINRWIKGEMLPSLLISLSPRAMEEWRTRDQQLATATQAMYLETIIWFSEEIDTICLLTILFI